LLNDEKLNLHGKPVVHENVWLPHQLWRYANTLDIAIFSLVPWQTVVFPFLQA